MADVTPPVGLASFAAAAISGADPLKTGFTAFFYSLRTALLPFLFIFNTDLLLIDVTVGHAIFIFFIALIAMLVFAAGTMGYFLTRSKIYESLALVLVAFILFRPGFLLNMVAPPYNVIAADQLFDIASNAPAEAELRLNLEGFNLDGQFVSATFMLPLGPKNSDGASRLANEAGLTCGEDGNKMIVDTMFGKAAVQALILIGSLPVSKSPMTVCPKKFFMCLHCFYWHW